MENAVNLLSSAESLTAIHFYLMNKKLELNNNYFLLYSDSGVMVFRLLIMLTPRLVVQRYEGRTTQSDSDLKMYDACCPHKLMMVREKFVAGV